MSSDQYIHQNLNSYRPPQQSQPPHHHHNHQQPDQQSIIQPQQLHTQYQNYQSNLPYQHISQQPSSHHQQMIIQPTHQQQPIPQQNFSPQSNQNQEQSTSTNAYLTLLGLADAFQRSHQYRLCIHCLESILTLKHQDVTINFHIQLKTRLNLCKLYLRHTLNTNQYVNAHLEKSLGANDEYKFEATYWIYKIFQKQKDLHVQLNQNGQQVDPSQLISLFNLDLIRNSLETSKYFPIWHIRLLFLIADILTKERDYPTAAYFMSMGIDFCTQNRISSYTHILFILNKGLVHLLQRNPNDLQATMQPCAALIENYQATNIHQIESLKIFFLILQVAYFLQCGQAKSVKGVLKNLQHYVQSLSGRMENLNEQDQRALVANQINLENFYWLHTDQLGILVYMMTVIHFLQSGYFEKTQKYMEKALTAVQVLRLKEQKRITRPHACPKSIIFPNGSPHITNKLHLMLLESHIRCSLSTGNRCDALKQLGEAFKICDQDNILMNSHAAQLHCLLGVYSLSVNNRDVAISHFNQCMKSTTDTDLWLYSAMNLALCYLNGMISTPNNNTTFKNQLLSILENVVPEKIQTQNTALTAFAHYFKALQAFLNSNYQVAQDALKEAIALSNSEDLLNITSNSYLFTGHISFLLNNFQDSFNMLVTGIDLADKMPDMNLRIYGNSILKDLYKYFNDAREADTSKIHSDLEQKYSADYFEALKMPQHALVTWSTNMSPKQILTNITNQLKSLNSQPSATVSASNSSVVPSTSTSVAQVQNNFGANTSVPVPVQAQIPTNQHQINQNQYQANQIHHQPNQQYHQHQPQHHQQHHAHQISPQQHVNTIHHHHQPQQAQAVHHQYSPNNHNQYQHHNHHNQHPIQHHSPHQAYQYQAQHLQQIHPHQQPQQHVSNQPHHSQQIHHRNNQY